MLELALNRQLSSTVAARILHPRNVHHIMYATVFGHAITSIPPTRPPQHARIPAVVANLFKSCFVGPCWKYIRRIAFVVIICVK